jgi:hypothetical protein
MTQTHHLIGVISDTHGLLRLQAVQALEGSELIIHAGDVGNAEVLGALQAVAPVRAVRGNTDRGAWAREIPAAEVVLVGGVLLYVLHDLHALDLDPAGAGFQAVIYGHSHRPDVDRRQGVLFLNPGSAGPRRFTLPVTVARLRLEGTSLHAEVVHLQI